MKYQYIKKVQVILKSVERCNIACTYCYYFFGGDDSYKKRPAVIKVKTVKDIANFLAQGARELGCEVINIVFHGGEPMMQKVKDFRECCEALLEAITPICRVQLNMQTNAMLVTEDWIRAFKEYQVCVGVSIDGPKEYNDKYRLDKKGRGSYERVVKGLKILRESNAFSDGSISVINHQFDYRKIYRHLIDELKFKSISFLLPDINYNTGFEQGATAERYGYILSEVFDEWLHDEGIYVRQIEGVLSFFQARKYVRKNIADEKVEKGFRNNQVIVIQSDGEVSVDDTYMTAVSWGKNISTPSVNNISLADYLEQPIFHEIDLVRKSTPKACQDCCWKKLCRGGDIENRYSDKNGFENASIFCEGLKIFYSHVVSCLVSNGYSIEEVEKI